MRRFAYRSGGALVLTPRTGKTERIQNVLVDLRKKPLKHSKTSVLELHFTKKLYFRPTAFHPQQLLPGSRKHLFDGAFRLSSAVSRNTPFALGNRQRARRSSLPVRCQKAALTRHKKQSVPGILAAGLEIIHRSFGHQLQAQRLVVLKDHSAYFSFFCLWTPRFIERAN